LGFAEFEIVVGLDWSSALTELARLEKTPIWIFIVYTLLRSPIWIL